MTGVQDMLNKNIFTKSLTFILYYAWQRNRKYEVRVMCVLHQDHSLLVALYIFHSPL